MKAMFDCGLCGVRGGDDHVGDCNGKRPTTLIETMARAMNKLRSWDALCKTDDLARAALSAIEAAGYDLVLRQHRDMGPGFTHHDGPDCPCFAAAPKVTE